MSLKRKLHINVIWISIPPCPILGLLHTVPKYNQEKSWKSCSIPSLVSKLFLKSHQFLKFLLFLSSRYDTLVNIWRMRFTCHVKQMMTFKNWHSSSKARIAKKALFDSPKLVLEFAWVVVLKLMVQPLDPVHRRKYNSTFQTFQSSAKALFTYWQERVSQPAA